MSFGNGDTFFDRLGQGLNNPLTDLGIGILMGSGPTVGGPSPGLGQRLGQGLAFASQRGDRRAQAAAKRQEIEARQRQMKARQEAFSSLPPQLQKTFQAFPELGERFMAQQMGIGQQSQGSKIKEIQYLNERGIPVTDENIARAQRDLAIGRFSPSAQPVPPSLAEREVLELRKQQIQAEIDAKEARTIEQQEENRAGQETRQKALAGIEKNLVKLSRLNTEIGEPLEAGNEFGGKVGGLVRGAVSLVSPTQSEFLKDRVDFDKTMADTISKIIELRQSTGRLTQGQTNLLAEGKSSSNDPIGVRASAIANLAEETAFGLQQEDPSTDVSKLLEIRDQWNAVAQQSETGIGDPTLQGTQQDTSKSFNDLASEFKSRLIEDPNKKTAQPKLKAKEPGKPLTPAQSSRMKRAVEKNNLKELQAMEAAGWFD